VHSKKVLPKKDFPGTLMGKQFFGKNFCLGAFFTKIKFTFFDTPFVKFEAKKFSSHKRDTEYFKKFKG
jgi:hypothetical protein